MTCRLSILSALMLVSLAATPSWGQTDADGILKSINGGWASGKIKDGTTIKVNSTGSRNARQDVAPRLALYKVALLARSAGYERFAIVKQSCGTLMVSNIPASHNCTVLAQLLRPGQEATARGKNRVIYFDVGAVIPAIEGMASQLQKF